MLSYTIKQILSFFKIKRTTNKTNFLIFKVVSMKLTQESPRILNFKDDFDKDFKDVDFQRKSYKKRNNLLLNYTSQLITVWNLKILKQYTCGFIRYSLEYHGWWWTKAEFYCNFGIFFARNATFKALTFTWLCKDVEELYSAFGACRNGMRDQM